MSEKNRIINLLTKETLNSTEVSKKLGIQINSVYVYLNNLLKENKVERITDKKPYKYRAITPIAYLKRLYEFMSDVQKCDVKEITELDIDFLTKIKELIV